MFEIAFPSPSSDRPFDLSPAEVESWTLQSLSSDFPYICPLLRWLAVPSISFLRLPFNAYVLRLHFRSDPPFNLSPAELTLQSLSTVLLSCPFYSICPCAKTVSYSFSLSLLSVSLLCSWAEMVDCPFSLFHPGVLERGASSPGGEYSHLLHCKKYKWWVQSPYTVKNISGE